MTSWSWRRLIEPRLDAPFPLWMIFPVVFAALYASHFSLLRLPYYWDEAGYYIPAAWDFFRTGSLIPTTTLTNAHPPLPSIYLALWWKASGFYPEVTREAVLIVAALGLLAVWKLVLRIHGSRAGRVLDRRAHRPLPHLVCAEHAGPRRHLRRRVRVVGPGLFAARSRPQSLGRGPVVHRRRALQGNRHRHSAHAGSHARGRRLPLPTSGSPALLARSRLAFSMHRAPGRLVRLALCQDRLPLRQSPVPSLQRPGHSRA